MTGLVITPAGAVCIGTILIADYVRRIYTVNLRRFLIMTGGAPLLLAGLQGGIAGNISAG